MPHTCVLKMLAVTTTINNTSVSIGLHILCRHVFTSSEYVPRSGPAGSQGNSVLAF